MRPCLLGVLLGATLACAAAQGLAASRNADPDWPCQQHLVPKLSPGLFWTGPSLADTTEWRKEPEIVALVEKITPRNVAADRGKEAIGSFIQGVGEDKPRRLSLVFAGLLEETNRQRDELIDRIKAFARRQRELADIASRAGEELSKIPADATGDDAARRNDLEQRRHYVSLAFQEAERTVRYACEAPVQLESRLGEYARALQAALP